MDIQDWNKFIIYNMKIHGFLPLDKYIEIINESNTSGRLIDQDFVYTKKGEKIDMQNLISKINTANALVASRYPFFAEGLYALKVIYTWMVPTMATDGTRLFINPKFSNDLTMKETIFVLCHEVMHCVLDHMERGRFHNRKKSNVAADYEVNQLLIADGIFNESDILNLGGLYDKQYIGMAYEPIYEIVKDKKGGNEGERGGKGGSGDGEGSSDDNEEPNTGDDKLSDSMYGDNSGGGGEVISQDDGIKIAKDSGYTDGDSMKKENTSGKWESISVKNASKLSGTTSGNAIRQAILERYAAAVNWKAELAKYIGKILSSTTVKMGRKRFIKDDILKSYSKDVMEDVNRIVFLIDTSGSVDDDQIKFLLSETQWICTAKGSKYASYVYFDTVVQSFEEIKKGQQPNVKMAKGGGGTNFDPPFQWVTDKYKYDVDLVVMFTDGYANDPSKPTYHDKVIWVVYDNMEYKAPFGKTINIKKSDIKKI